MLQRVIPTVNIVSYFRLTHDNRLCLHQAVRLWNKKWQCSKCDGHFQTGDLDIVNRNDCFICSNCLPQFFRRILEPPYVLKYHLIEAMELYQSANLQRNYISLKIHFYFGRYWRKNNEFFWFKDRAVNLFQNTCKRAKLALDMLSLCLMRIGFYKDLRQFFAKLIWPNEIICWLQEE